MTESRKSAPHFGALRAYEDSKLSADGVRRVEKKLDESTEWRDGLGALRAADSVLKEAQELSVPALDWDEMESQLARTWSEAPVGAESFDDLEAEEPELPADVLDDEDARFAELFKALLSDSERANKSANALAYAATLEEARGLEHASIDWGRVESGLMENVASESSSHAEPDASEKPKGRVISLAKVRASQAELPSVKRDAADPASLSGQHDRPSLVAVEKSAQGGSSAWWLVGGVVVAAAALLFFFYKPTADHGQSPIANVEETSQGTTEETPTVVARALRPGAVTAIAGTVLRTNAAGDSEQLSVGSPVDEGDLIETEGRVDVRVASGTGVSLAGAGRFIELREGTMRFALTSGVIGNEVASLEDGDAYEISAGEYQVRVLGTRFEVSLHDDGHVEVLCDEGMVAVLKDGDEVGRVAAPGSWSSRGEAQVHPVPAPIAFELGDQEWGTLTLPNAEGLRSWTFADGRTLEASSPLALRMPRGEHTLTATQTSGREITFKVTVAETGELSEHELSEAMQRRARPEAASPEVQQIVQAGLRGLNQCYDRALRRYPEVSGRFRMNLSVGNDGSVRRVAFRGARGEVPDSLVECLEQRARGWNFPTGPVTLRVPINLRAR